MAGLGGSRGHLASYGKDAVSEMFGEAPGGFDDLNDGEAAPDISTFPERKRCAASQLSVEQ